MVGQLGVSGRGRLLSELIGVTDEEWALLGPLLPPERGRCARPAHDNRRYVEGMLWVARTGAQWRHLPAAYGKWNSVYQRFRRWSSTGVWDALLQTLCELAGPENDAHMVDSTVVRAHHCAAGVKGGIRRRRRSVAPEVGLAPRCMPAAMAPAGRSGSC